MQFSIYTLGCKVNQYESQVMAKILTDAGFVQTSHKAQPDIFIINSCTVTAQSDHKVRQVLNRTRRENPASTIILTGCMPQAFPEECSALEQADIILGNSSRAEILPALQSFLSSGQRIVDISEHNTREKFEDMEIEEFQERTRAFLKIEDGCNRFCSYCIIPYARGRVRSKELESIKREVQALAKGGYKEIVLVGINLSAFGQDIGSSLVEAVKIVSEVDGIERVRLGSLEPYLMTKETIDKLAGIQNFCPQFHLSLQSGCTKTLERMNRHYTADDYREIVENIRSAFENASITTDIMVGFAGESHEEFEDSLSFAKEIKFAKAHVFAYSRRKGTKAYNLPNQISNAVKDSRSKEMIAATTATAIEFAANQVGLVCSVLFEREVKENIWEGYSKNYTPVHVISEENLANQILNVKITAAEGVICVGEII